MKKIISVLLVISLLLFSTITFHEEILSSVVPILLGRMLGAPVEISGFDIDPGTKTLHVTDLNIFNPDGFPDGLLVDIDDLSITWDLSGIKEKKIVIPLVKAHVKELVAIKNSEGKFNVDALDILPAPGGGLPFGFNWKDITISTFRLSIDKVVYKDYKTGNGVPSVKVFNVNVKDQEYKDLPGLGMILAVIFRESLARAAIDGAFLYGLLALGGLTFWPAGLAVVAVGPDSASAEVDAAQKDVYWNTVKVFDEQGAVRQGEEEQGLILGTVNGVDYTVKMDPLGATRTDVKVSARYLMVPRSDLAKGMLYQITEKFIDPTAPGEKTPVHTT